MLHHKYFDVFFYRISPAGQYLKLIDLEYCLINTSFSQQEIIDWFKSFRFLEVVNTLKLNNINNKNF